MTWNRNSYRLYKHNNSFICFHNHQVMTVRELVSNTPTITPPVLPHDTDSFIDRSVREMMEGSRTGR